MSGQIVIVNGTSGSGKSSTCEAFAARQDDFWLLFGIDHFIAGSFPSKFGHHGPRAAEGIQAVPMDPAEPDGPLRWRFGPQGERAFATMHEWIAASARMGCNLICDHLLMSDPPVIADLAWRLEGLPALLVTLRPPFEVLEARVAERKMTRKLPVEIMGEDDPTRRIIDRLNRLRGWFYEDVYANDIADLTIDTAAHGIDAVVALIETRLAQGPGTAFETLRGRLARPW